MSTVRNSLPERSLVGTSGLWELPDRDGAVTGIKGKYLGFSSSHTEKHWHPGKEFAPTHKRCSGCRWSEFRVFRKSGELGYVVHTVGASVVPGEVDGYRPQARFVLTPPEVLEALTTTLKPRPGHAYREREVFFSDAARRVLSQASYFDEGIRDAWENRRVA